MDIGCYNNDYVGSDPTRGLYYTYNGTFKKDEEPLTMVKIIH